MKRGTLSGRLTLTNVLILAVGLILAAGASVVGTYMLLLSEVDDSVKRERGGFENAQVTTEMLQAVCGFAKNATTEGDRELEQSLSRETFVLLGPDGKPLKACEQFSHPDPGDRSAFLAKLGDPKQLAESGEVVTVSANDKHYRAAVGKLGDEAMVVFATPYDGVLSAVRKLLWVETAIAIVLLTLLAALSWRAARWRLKPLEDMVETASAISEGDYSRRVGATAHGAAEVEQLRDALNAMLHQIESAMRTREHASARLRQFLADASHELRTPLATVRGYLQLYEKGMLGHGDEEERALKRVGEEADRMGRLVDELLALARLDAHPSRERRPVDLAELARDGAADLLAQQPGRPVEVRTNGRAQVVGDEAQLRQVVGNLLANVRTHTPEEAACAVSVAAENGDGGAGGDGGRAMVLRIADTGPGMREADAARIFDRFFRADPDRGRVAGGSGLGMSIVRAVVEAHGGEVALRTAPGEGLAVTVRLPAHT
ncbi:HAMP domain-containing histidine kinase [Streptomyces sp. A7024]|uniref:histidine kinase n=1 Tax=Streptomyces coryli TaxID=1128680 RepID=A0A6G4U9F8_9ACTN|nr:HAMP domain-containing histidine kinase [Streptomyces coryli]